MTNNTLGNRIKFVRESNGLVQEEFRKRLGIARSSLVSYENDESIPKSNVLTDICSIFNISPEWLLMGTGQPIVSEHAQNSNKRVIVELRELINSLPVKNGNLETFASKLTEFILIPMVGAVLSAGTGSLQTEGGSERKYAFRSDFLRRKGNMTEMVVMRVEGDSMSPSIEHGDVVLIDQSQKVLRPSSIYAVGVEDMIYLKRVNAKPGKVILESDNPDYEPFEVQTTGDLADLVRIIGRIVWVSREL